MSGSPSGHQSRVGWQFSVRIAFAALLLVALVCGAAAWLHRRIIDPRNRMDAIHAEIMSLQQHCPNDMTIEQWDAAIAWTNNLHSNSLMSSSRVDRRRLAAFQARLESKLREPVGMETINWIWSEYAQLCPQGESYQRFKPMMMDEIQAWGRGP